MEYGHVGWKMPQITLELISVLHLGGNVSGFNTQIIYLLRNTHSVIGKDQRSCAVTSCKWIDLSPIETMVLKIKAVGRFCGQYVL